MFASDLTAIFTAARESGAAIEFTGTEYRVPATGLVRSIIRERALGSLVARDGDHYVFAA